MTTSFAGAGWADTLPVLTPIGDLDRDPDAERLIGLVEAWQEAHQEPRIDAEWFHASSLGKTDAQLIDEYLGRNNDRHDARLLTIFEYGHQRDAAWKRYLHAAGLSVFPDPEDEEARRVTLTALRLTGRCDDVIQLPGEPEPWVFEFKTMGAYQFGLLREPKPEHVMQCHAYMAGLGLSDALILVECKNNGARIGFRIRFDVALWMQVTTRLRRLRREAERLAKPTRAAFSDAARRKAEAMEV